MREMHRFRFLLGPLAVLWGWALAGCQTPEMEGVEVGPVPALLSETGLFVDGSTETRPEHLAFSPQYPLWTDGADKRRWIHLPEGTWIDASDPEDWTFPAGTRLWKEFAFGGRRVETRYMEALPDGSWRYATYVWSDDQRDAALASGEGLTVTGDGWRHTVPSEADCRACHEGRPSRVLGFGALQLSSDRDPLAPHGAASDPRAVDLAELVARGLVRGSPGALERRPPRIAARSPVERAALGYLHGNCGGCHNDEGPLAPLGLVLWQPAGGSGRDEAVRSMVGRASRFRTTAEPEATDRIAPGHPEHSILALRMRSREPHLQMPPIGTQVVDESAAALVDRWIVEDLGSGSLAAAFPNERTERTP